MQLYAKYLKEYDGFDIIIEDHGYVTYKVNGLECYVKEIFVEKEFRKTGLASKMVDKIAEIAKNSGCQFLIGTVYDNVENKESASISLMAQLKYGFRVASIKQNLIILSKEI